MERYDTIAAISTPPGSGGIAVIRISGSGAGSVIGHCFKASRRAFPDSSKDISFGRVISAKGDLVDEAICLFMKGPASYTGEDVAELQCHGGVAAAKAVLLEAIRSGARLARAGEFTHRAFLNGKMSLLKAESVLAMIKARTEKARVMAAEMLDGNTSKQAEKAKELVSGLLVKMEAVLDWPDEMSDEGSAGGTEEIFIIEAQIESMIIEANKGRLLLEGVKVAIIGRPNMGKSSIMNRLLGINRAMVSDIPGTTRDTVEETANVEGIPIRFADTAGIGKSTDPLVAEGVQRAKQAVSTSSVIVYVAAVPQGLTSEDVDELSGLKRKAVIIALNKADLITSTGVELVPPLPRHLLDTSGFRTVLVSAKTGEGMELLKEAIATEAGSITEFDEPEASTSRWIACLEGCLDRLKSARTAIASGLPHEAVCLDLRDALYSLSELTGDTTADDIIGMVFEKFCIGK